MDISQASASTYRIAVGSASMNVAQHIQVSIISPRLQINNNVAPVRKLTHN
jgi:hypothetical protein